MEAYTKGYFTVVSMQVGSQNKRVKYIWLKSELSNFSWIRPYIKINAADDSQAQLLELP
jgi:hypothetical protein